MTSTTNSFKSQVKNLNQKTTLRDSDSYMLKLIDYNPYYTNVVCSFPFYQDIICIRIDHRNLVNFRVSADAFNDLVVVDTSGFGVLPHYVQSYKTDYTCIFVKRLSDTGNTTLRLYHGNIGAISTSDISQFVPQSSSLQAWFRADRYDDFRNYLNYDNDFVIYWQNSAKKTNPALWKYSTTVTYPISKINQIGTLPIIRFSGNSKLVSPNLINLSDEITIAIVVKASTLANYQSIVRMQDAGSGWVIPCWGGNAEVRLSNDDATPYLSSGVVANEWNICIVRWKQNTTNGFNVYRNGALVNQRNSTNTPLPSRFLHLGALENNSEFSNCDLAEVLIYDKYLSDGERQELEKYLNAKWRVYNSQPTYTIGAYTLDTLATVDDSDITPPSSWSVSNKISNNIFGLGLMQGDIKYEYQQTKSLATCSNLENWANTTLSDNKELGEYTRQFTPFLFQNIRTGLVNQDLTVYNNGITSTLDDYIEISIIFQSIAGIDFNLSGILLTDNNNFTKNALFNTNASQFNVGLNILKIKRGDFGGGTFDWSQVRQIALFIEIGAGYAGDPIIFGKIRLVQNITDNKYLQLGQNAILGLTVSDDSNLSTYTSRVANLKIIETKRELEQVKLNLQNILMYCKENNVKFGDLPSFGDGDYVYKSYAKDGILPVARHIFKLLFLLNFILPRIDVQILTGAIDAIENKTLPNYTTITSDVLIRKEDLVFDTVDQVLQDCWAILTTTKQIGTNMTPNKLMYGFNSSDGYTTPYNIDDNLIYSYGLSSSDNSQIINQVKFNLQNYGQYYQGECLFIGSGDSDFELPPNQDTTVFIDLHQNENAKKRNRRVLSNPMFNYWNITDVQGEDSYNNTNISVRSISILDSKTIAIVFTNSGGTTKWTRNMSIRCNYVDNAPFYITSTINNLPLTVLPPLVVENGSIYYKNQDSISKYGVLEHVISGDYPYLLATDNTELEFGVDIGIIRALNILSKPAIIHELEMQYVEDIHVSLLVEFKNENGKRIQGVVQEVDWYIPTMKIKIREIN